MTIIKLISVYDVERNNVCLFSAQYEAYKLAYTLGIKCEVWDATAGGTKSTAALGVGRLIIQM
jgi:hypothetical protein